VLYFILDLRPERGVSGVREASDRLSYERSP